MNKALAGAALAGAALAFSVPTAFAQTQGPWYLGGSLGQAEVDVDCTGTTSCDDKDSSWKIFGGYQVNRNFAVELGYANLGEIAAGIPPFGPIPASTLSIESTAWDLSAVGLLPLSDRFSVFGRLGLYRADTDLRVAFPGLGAAGTDSDSNTDLTFGIGLRYDFTQNLGIRAEWQRYGDVSASDAGEGDIDVMSIGVVWKF